MQSRQLVAGALQLSGRMPCSIGNVMVMLPADFQPQGCRMPDEQQFVFDYPLRLIGRDRPDGTVDQS